MDAQQKGLLTLIKSAITCQRYPMPEGFDLQEAFDTIHKHQVSAIVYYGAVNCGYDPDDMCMQQLFGSCYSQIVHSEKQIREIEQLLSAFEVNSIDVLPLKGAVLKRLYPKPEMRRMGDADILIREEQLPLIKPILEENGYTFVRDLNHEIKWDKPALHLELHRMLIPAHHKHYHVYFGTGWDLAVPAQHRSHVYAMSPENTFLFIFTHLTKHYIGGGIGLIHMTDLWVYTRENPALDKAYIKGELKKLGLDGFYENVVRTLHTWFADQPADAVTETITQRIFFNGVYGHHTDRVVSVMARTTRENTDKRPSTVKRVLCVIFPDRNALQTQGYPILQKWPVLLPFVWVARWLRLIFVHRDRVRIKIQDFRNTSVKNVDAFERSLEFVGIRFPDKE